MADSVQFIGGDHLVEPFLINAEDGSIADLTDVPISGSITWDEGSIALASNSGLHLSNVKPDLAEGSDPQEPHGYLVLTPEQTSALPMGRQTVFRLTVVNKGLRSSTFQKYLERLP
jgi:hypothetical protein